MNIIEETCIYKKTPQADLVMHIFRPHAAQPLPLSSAIVFFHGGGWRNGDPSQFFQQSRYFARRGMWAASAQYRLIKKHHTSPYECVKDGRSALRWVRSHSREYGIDPSRIAAAGGSAGGHVAASTASDIPVEEASDDTAISSIPNALVLFNPVLDTTSTGWKTGATILSDQAKALSPFHHISEATPPTITFHGTADSSVPFRNAEDFTRALREKGTESELVPFENAGHGFFNSGRDDNSSPFIDTMQATEQFLYRIGFLADAGISQVET